MASAARVLQYDATHEQSRSGLSADVSIPISDVIRKEGKLRDDRIALEVMERLRICTHETWLDRSYIWTRNLLYLHGEQNIKWNEAGRRYVRKAPARERSKVSNRLNAMLHHQASKMVQGRPGFTTMPENTDLDKRRGALAGERLLVHDWRKLKLGSLRYRAIIDCLAINMGFIEVGWDPRGGRLFTDPEFEHNPDGTPALDAMGGRIRRFERGKAVVAGYRWEGSLYARVRSPFSVHVPPSLETPDLDDSPYIITTDWIGEEQIRTMLGLSKDFVFASPDPEAETVEPVSSFLQRFATTRGVHPRARSDQALLVRYIQKQTDVKGFENGKTYYVVNGQLVHQDRGQLDDGRYQIFNFPWKPRSGQFWCHAFLTDLIEPQARYNQGLSHAYTWMSLFANPNVLVPRGSGLPQDIAFNFRRYDFNPAAGMPSFWTPPAPPAAMTALMDRNIQDLSSIASQSPFSTGQPVSGAPAAKYAQLMQDADAQEAGPIVAMHATAWERLGSCLLDLHKAYDTDERLIRTVGRANRPELKSFKKSDLPDRADVVVQEHSMFSTLPSARIEQVEKLSQAGFFGAFADSPRTRRKLLESIRMPDMLDIDPPDERLNDHLDTLTERVIDGGVDATIPPWAEKPLVEALQGALAERLTADDVFDFDEEVIGRVMAWKQQLDEKLAEFQEQEDKAEEKQREDLFGMQARGELLKSQLRARERIVGEAAKAGANLLAGQAGPAPGAGPPGKGGKPGSETKGKERPQES